MAKTPHYYVVEASVLPEIFLKVAEAKRLLDVKEADTVNRAVQMVGISRSAFYKYRDGVRPFNDMLHGRIINFQMMLKDEPGSLSAVLELFAQSGANILTIQQGIPVSGCAAVTIAAETNALSWPLGELESRLQGVPCVVKCEFLAG